MFQQVVHTVLRQPTNSFFVVPQLLLFVLNGTCANYLPVNARSLLRE